jgi:hypothetical protein
VRVARAAQSMSKSVERTTTKKLVEALFTPDAAWRIEELPAEVAEGIALEDVKALLQQQLVRR